MCLGQFLTESIKEQKKEQEATEIKKDDIIKVLAGAIYRYALDECPFDKKCDKRSCGLCTQSKDVYIKCWIDWAEEQVKNGT